MDRYKDTARIDEPTTVADISVAPDGDVLISFEDVGIVDPAQVRLMLTAFGIQILYNKVVKVDLIIPLRKLRDQISQKPSILLAQVKNDGNIQVFDNVPYVNG